jgi:hypothetical protein
VQKFGGAAASLRLAGKGTGITVSRIARKIAKEQCRDKAGGLFFLVGGFLAGSGFRFAVRFLGELVRLGGVLHGLPRKFVGGLMVLFVVMHGSDTMRVGGQFVEFRRSLVRIFGHVWGSSQRPSR